MAVGPIVMFSHEPKIIYINDAINAIYIIKKFCNIDVVTQVKLGKN